MSQATIIAINVTLNDISIDDLGITIAASGSPDSSITLSDLYTTFELVASNDLKTEVITEYIVINDGSGDLSVDDALQQLKIETEKEDVDQDASLAGVNFDDLLLTGGCGGTDPHIIATKAGNLILLGGCS